MARERQNDNPPAPPPRYRVRVSPVGPLLLLALALVAVVYAFKVCSVEEVFAALPVHDPERYGNLVIMAAALLGVIVIAKWLFSNRR